METFIVAIDHSKYLEKILGYLGRMLKDRNDIRIVFLHIKEPCLLIAEALEHEMDKDILIQKVEELKRNKKKCREEQKKFDAALQERIHKIVSPVFKDTAVHFDFVEETGDYAQIILAKAKEHSAKTIVVGKKGDSIISEYLIGSTAEKLSRISKGYTLWLVD